AITQAIESGEHFVPKVVAADLLGDAQVHRDVRNELLVGELRIRTDIHGYREGERALRESLEGALVQRGVAWQKIHIWRQRPRLGGGHVRPQAKLPGRLGA